VTLWPIKRQKKFFYNYGQFRRFFPAIIQLFIKLTFLSNSQGRNTRLYLANCYIKVPINSDLSYEILTEIVSNSDQAVNNTPSYKPYKPNKTMTFDIWATYCQKVMELGRLWYVLYFCSFNINNSVYAK
jgi:hypothetical protein